MIDTHVHIGGDRYAPMDQWVDAEQQHGLSGAVLVQRLGLTDNDELLTAWCSRTERRGAIVIPADVNAAERLLSAGVTGFRLPPLGHQDADEHWRLLGQASGVASVTGPYAHIASDEFVEIVDAHPEVTFRLEHVATFEYAEHPDPAAGFEPVLRLARRPNVILMWSGFFHYSAAGYPYRDAWPVLEASLEAYGAGRICWSGDWNRAGGTGASYQADLDLIPTLPFVGPAEVDQILNTTARTYFGLEH